MLMDQQYMILPKIPDALYDRLGLGQIFYRNLERDKQKCRTAVTKQIW
jgi:hypothetical protein